jgi:hypothetical protein
MIKTALTIVVSLSLFALIPSIYISSWAPGLSEMHTATGNLFLPLVDTFLSLFSNTPDVANKTS